MKLYQILATTLITLLTVGNCVTPVYAQKRINSSLVLRGPQIPPSTDYKDYKTYTLNLNFPDNLMTVITRGSSGVGKAELKKVMSLTSFNEVNEGEFIIDYNITKFKHLDTDIHSGIASHYFGFEADVQVKDKEGKVIYTRYMPSIVNSYDVDQKTGVEWAAAEATVHNYQNLIDDFEKYYLYGPDFELNFIEFKMPKKGVHESVVDFNQSSEVFKTIYSVNRNEWPALFEIAQGYWKNLMNFKEANDKDVVKDVRLGAGINLAASHLMLGNLEEAQKLLPFIKENDRTLIGFASYHDRMKAALEYVKEYALNTKLKETIQPIEDKPVPRIYSDPNDVFKYVPLKGEIVTKKGEKVDGNIKLMFNKPAIITLQMRKGEQSTLSALGALAGSLATDNSVVYVEAPNAKKPVKMKIDDVSEVRTSDNKVYQTAIIGNFLSEDKRYSLIEKVDGGKNLELYQEVFPSNKMIFKRSTDEKFTQIPISFNFKKSLKDYFKDCPQLHSRIDAGEFMGTMNTTYQRIIKAYTQEGCN